jgi:uncharacterized protein YjeT (DUF2065 family)
MNAHTLQIGASIALCVLGLVLVVYPEAGQRLMPIEVQQDRDFAVRLLGMGMLCAVFLAWSIKDFIET